MPPLTARPSVLFFDVNETLLDLTPVKKQVNDVLRDEGGAALWFSTMLHHSLVMAVSDQYAEFTEVGTAALQMLGRNRDIAIHDNEAKEILGGMRRLKPHADVAPALVRLQRAGFRLAALTNSSQAGVGAQLAFAGLENYFERQMFTLGLRVRWALSRPTACWWLPTAGTSLAPSGPACKARLSPAKVSRNSRWRRNPISK
jgi:2-haloacid dehalogenase